MRFDHGHGAWRPRQPRCRQPLHADRLIRWSSPRSSRTRGATIGLHRRVVRGAQPGHRAGRHDRLHDQGRRPRPLRRRRHGRRARRRVRSVRRLGGRQRWRRPRLRVRRGDAPVQRQRRARHRRPRRRAGRSCAMGRRSVVPRSHRRLDVAHRSERRQRARRELVHGDDVVGGRRQGHARPAHLVLAARAAADRDHRDHVRPRAPQE